MSTLWSELGIETTQKLSVEGFKRLRSPLINMEEAVRAKVEDIFKL